MAVEIKVPSLGESVSEATVAQWLKQTGDSVQQDETIAELETDKVSLEVNAPEAGVLSQILVEAGNDVEAGATLGMIDTDGKAAKSGAAKEQNNATAEESKPAPATSASNSASTPAPSAKPSGADDSAELSPAVRKLVEENNLDPSQITGTGKDGRLVKGDVLAFMENGGGSAASTTATAGVPATQDQSSTGSGAATAPRQEERVRMTRLRQRIAERLKEAQNSAAMLTTFNDVDMTKVMALRSTYKDDFEKKHGVRLGFMAFFVKAAIEALKAFPAVNAEIDGQDIIYKNYYDIGVAVGTDQGLVVPVLRDTDHKSFADIEKEIGDFANRAREGQLSMEELTGGTFTISNGGVYGSLMSTPIINPPQSAILGMHRIEKRPVVVNDEVVVRPMMYLAMSYDHRIIDGTESVRFLKTIKQAIEDPQRLLLSV